MGGGQFWVRSDLDSRKKIRVFNFRGGGVLGNVRFGLWEEFHFGVGGVLEPNSRTGYVIENLVKNFWKTSLLVHHS